MWAAACVAPPEPAHPSVDTVVLTGYLGGYGGQHDDLETVELDVARSLAAAADASGRVLVCHLMYADAPPARLLRREGVPVYREIEGGVRTLARIALLAPAAGWSVWASDCFMLRSRSCWPTVYAPEPGANSR